MDRDCIDANIDQSTTDRSLWIRVDIEIPGFQLYRSQRADGGPMGYLALTPDEADDLAHRLADMAQRARSTETP